MKRALAIAIYLMASMHLVVVSVSEAELKEKEWVNGHSQELRKIQRDGNPELADKLFSEIMEKGNEIFKQECIEGIKLRFPIFIIYTILLVATFFAPKRNHAASQT